MSAPLLAALITLTSCIDLAAQQVVSDNWRAGMVSEARGQLQSQDPKSVAWGAFNAGTYQLDELLPELRAALLHPPHASDQGRQAMISALLEAAIQLRRALPWEAVIPYLRQSPVQVAILMPRMAGALPANALLDAMTSSSGGEWVAIANVLLLRQPAGLAAEFLRDLRLVLTVSVTSGQSPGIGSGVGGGVGGERVRLVPAGYPPSVSYEFRYSDYDFTMPGWSLLSGGPRPVFFVRTPCSRTQCLLQQPDDSRTSSKARLTYLAALLASRGPAVRDGGAGNESALTWNANDIGAGRNASPFGVNAEESISVTWKDADDLRARVANTRTEMVQRYRMILDGLFSRKLLTAEERELRNDVAIVVMLHDDRADKSEPLPAIQ
jgi:hypothetical protein